MAKFMSIILKPLLNDELRYGFVPKCVLRPKILMLRPEVHLNCINYNADGLDASKYRAID